MRFKYHECAWCVVYWMRCVHTIDLALSNSYHMDGSFTFGNKQNGILLRIIHRNWEQRGPISAHSLRNVAELKRIPSVLFLLTAISQPVEFSDKSGVCNKQKKMVPNTSQQWVRLFKLYAAFWCVHSVWCIGSVYWLFAILFEFAFKIRHILCENYAMEIDWFRGWCLKCKRRGNEMGLQKCKDRWNFNNISKFLNWGHLCWFYD